MRVHLGDPHALAELIERPGVIQIGHYRLLSGLHSDAFIAFSHIARDSLALDTIASWLLPTIAPWAPSAVVAPSTAGVGLASTIARSLNLPLHLAILNEAGRPSSLYGDAVLSDDRVLLVNDLATTGQGVSALARCSMERGAAIAGAAWFASRSDVPIAQMLGVPTAHVATGDLESWEQTSCLLCQEGVHCEDALDLN